MSVTKGTLTVVRDVVTEERCPCGAVLSRYREPGETLCAPCRKRQEAQAPPTRVLPPEQLVDVVAGLLLVARGLHPGRRLHVRQHLQKLGVEADHVDVFQAVQKIRRRYGWAIDADERQAGHVLKAWPYQFRRRRIRRGQQIPLFK